jgi:hypothetical protein
VECEKRTTVAEGQKIFCREGDDARCWKMSVVVKPWHYRSWHASSINQYYA